MVSTVVLLSPSDSLYRAAASMASTASAGAQQAMVQLVPQIPPLHFHDFSALVVVPHSWDKHQKPAKHYIENFVKLTDHSHACNDLTSFESEAHAMTGNGSYLNMQKLAWKNL